MKIENHPVLWSASKERIAASNIQRYLNWLAANKNLHFTEYADLWQWSVSELEAFWASIWEFAQVASRTPYTKVLGTTTQPGTQWFPGATLNYVDQVVQAARSKAPGACAIRHGHENGSIVDVSWESLLASVGALAAHLRRIGIKPGDRVVAILPNAPEAVISLLACASVGAVWSSCAPEMGASAVLDRFSQIAPRVMIAVDGYEYGGRVFERREALSEFVAKLPSIEQVIVISKVRPELGAQGICATAVTWEAALAQPAALDPIALPFDHPLWIVYSSGTTGLPKGIVHGHGGIVVEHLKAMLLHHEATPESNYCWLSATGWIVWNIHVSSLLVGSTMVIFEGRPDYPDASAIWKFLEKAQVNVFGCGAAFYTNAMKSGVIPNQVANLTALKGLGSTGSPLPDEAYDWIYQNINADTWLAPASGGTDFASGFVGGNLLLPVRRGEMQCSFLGAGIYAFDPQGKPLVNEVGELVCTTPLPSMPIYFWNDPEGKRLHDAYYDMYPGIWRHGDWIEISERGSCIIYGRSDSTINRHGIRMGTSEIYRVVEDVPEVIDSMVVDLEYLGRESYMPLFVVLREGLTLNDAVRAKIVAAIKQGLSARYLPNDMFEVPAIPRTLTGKKMEIPIRRLLLGEPAAKIANRDAMANPSSLEWYFELAKTRVNSQ
jgi:acetoacetyl-CoA synthetase